MTTSPEAASHRGSGVATQPFPSPLNEAIDQGRPPLTVVFHFPQANDGFKRVSRETQVSSGEDEEVSNTPFSTISLVMKTASSQKTASVLFLLSLISVCSIISSPPFANLCLWLARTQCVYTFDELIPQCHSVKGEGAFARACNS